MNPRESSLLQAAATLLSANRDTAYGPAHAVRDALALQEEVTRQVAEREIALERRMDEAARMVGAA